MSVQLNDLLWSKPAMNGGRLCAAGTGVSVLRIVCCHKQGDSPETIVENYPQLSLATIYAALAYYYANRDEVDAAIDAQEAEYERLAAEDRIAKAAKA